MGETLVVSDGGVLEALYEEIWSRSLREQGETTHAHRLVAAADLVPPAERLLDVGCGDGSLALLVREKVREVHGVDISPTALRLAQAKGILVRRLDVDREPLPYRAGAFGAVTCVDVIEHVLDPRRLLAEAARVLAPGGALVLTIPNVRYVHVLISLALWGRFPATSGDPEGYDGGHLHHFTFGDVRALLQSSGFSRVEEYGLYRWARRSWKGWVKELVKALIGERLKREFFSASVVVRANRSDRP